jgi:hypothetical protein
MTMPGFTAERSLEQSSKAYGTLQLSLAGHRSGVVPQAGSQSTGGRAGIETITFEPETCVTRCLFLFGKRMMCYTACY